MRGRGEEEEDDQLDKEAELEAQEEYVLTKEADAHLEAAPRQRFAAAPANPICKPRQRWWLLWLLWLLSLQQTGAVTDPVTYCGDGWFSKIDSSHVDAGAYCATLGGTSIDAYGGNYGDLCRTVYNQAGGCIWGQRTCGQTVSWHCVGITDTTTATVFTTSATITVSPTSSNTATATTSTSATTSGIISSTKCATTTTISTVTTTSSDTETTSTSTFATTSSTTSATQSATSHTNTNTEVTTTGSTSTTSSVSTTTTQSKSTQTESSSASVTFTTITETTTTSVTFTTITETTSWSSSITSVTPTVITITKTLSGTNTHVTSSATTTITTSTSITPSATTITKTFSGTNTPVTSSATATSATLSVIHTFTSVTISDTTTKTLSSTNTHVTSSDSTTTTALSNTNTFTSITPSVTTITASRSYTKPSVSLTVSASTTTRSQTSNSMTPSTTTTAATSTTTPTVTATETLSEMTSATTGTTTTESPCGLPPQLAHGNADALSRCAGLRHGQECEPNCIAGFFHSNHGLRIRCENGIWQVEGECLRHGANASIEAAVQTLIRLSMELWQPDSSKLTTGRRWALAHYEDLLTAFAQTVRTHPSQLRLDLLEAVQSRRLKLSNSTSAADTVFTALVNSSGESLISVPIVFDVRLTLLLGRNATEEELQKAAKDLAFMTTPQQGEALVTAIDNQLQTKDSEGSLVPLGISASAISSVITIIEYVLPAAQWIVGDWDTSACHSSCEDGVPRSTSDPNEEREVLCSRGPLVACLGPGASQAGPMPVLVQVCSACAKSFFANLWVLLLAVLVACCCGIFAGVACFRCHRSGPWAMQGTYNLKNLAGIEAKFQIKAPQQGNDSEADFGMDGELGVKPHVSRRGSSASVASSKRHIVWDVDMEKVSSFFAKQGSTLWDQQLKKYQSQQSLQSEQREGLREIAFPSQLGRQRSGTLLDASRTDVKNHCNSDELLAMRV